MTENHPKPTWNLRYFLKKRRLATLRLYICIFIASWLCLLVAGKHIANIEDHNAHIGAQADAIKHYLRFKAIREKDSIFYRYCVIHAVFNKIFYPKESIKRSLIRLRKNVDISFTQITYEQPDPFFEEEDDFKKYLDANAKQMVRAAKEMKWYSDSAITSNRQFKGFTAANGRDRIALSDLQKYVPSTAYNELNWVYWDQFDEDFYDKYINSAINYNAVRVFSNSHNHKHESAYAYYLLSVTQSYDSVQSFLDSRWRYLTDKVINEDPQMLQGSSVSSATFLGFEFSLGFLLYIIAPTVVFFYTREFWVIREMFKRYPRSCERPCHYLLYNYRSLFKGLAFYRTIAVFMEMLEVLIRLLGVAIILYGCLFRFNYQHYDNIPFNLVVRNHINFDIIDIINLCSLLVILSVFSSYRIWDINRNDILGKYLAYPLAIGCMLLLPALIFLLIAILEKGFLTNYVSGYSVVYCLIFSVLIFIWFNRSWRKGQNIMIYYAMCVVYTGTLGSTFLALLYIL